MGSTASGHLLYGYALGGGDAGWYINEATQYGEWTPAWRAEQAGGQDDLEEVIWDRLTAVVAGFVEPDPHPHLYTDGRPYQQIRGTPEHVAHMAWSSRRRAAQESLGLSLHGVGGYSSGEIVLTVAESGQSGLTFPVDVAWSETKRLDFADLDGWRERLGWDARLQAAVQALQVTPVELDGYYWQEDVTRTPVGPAWILAASYG